MLKEDTFECCDRILILFFPKICNIWLIEMKLSKSNCLYLPGLYFILENRTFYQHIVCLLFVGIIINNHDMTLQDIWKYKSNINYWASDIGVNSFASWRHKLWGMCDNIVTDISLKLRSIDCNCTFALSATSWCMRVKIWIIC